MSGGTLSVVTGSREKEWQADGKTYTLSTLRMRGWAQLEEWAKNEVLDKAKDLVNGIKDRELAREILKDAQAEASNISITDPFFLQKMQSLGGVQQLMFVSLKRKHPAITLEEAGNLVGIENADEFLEIFFYLNEGITQKGTPEGNSPATPDAATQ